MAEIVGLVGVGAGLLSLSGDLFHGAEKRLLQSFTVTDALTVCNDGSELLARHLCQADDDYGIVAIRVNKRKGKPQMRSRSSSQHPAISRRLTAHEGVEGIQARSWLPNFHLCPYDMRLRFDCTFGRSELSMQSYLRGVSRSPSCG